MEAKELIQEELKSIKSQLETVQAEKIKAAADKSAADVQKLNEQIGEFKEREAAMQKQYDEMAIRIKDVKAGADQNKSYSQLIMEGVEAKKASLASMKENMQGSANFNVKAAVTMTTGSYSGGNVGLTTFDSEFVRVVRRQPFLRQIISVRPLGTNGISWAEQSNPQGGAGQTAEGAAKTQASFEYVERREGVKKITSFIKTSKESLDDLPALASEINQELVELVQLQLDTQLLSGDNTGQNLKGILQYAPAFSVTGSSLAGGVGVGVDKPNRYDVLRAAAWQIANTGKGKFTPNYVILNPMDAASMDVTKDSNGQYVIPPFATAGGMIVYGLKVIENVGVASGTFVAGDFSKSTLALREDININIGYDGNDFTNNLITILAEMRAGHYVKTNNVGAFVQGTFTTAITALTKS